MVSNTKAKFNDDAEASDMADQGVLCFFFIKNYFDLLSGF